MTPSDALGRGDTAAVMRSVRLYHGDRARNARMDALYGRFVRAGDLVMDIGAHVGDRVSSFRRLGARVIAVEPQPGPARALRVIHGRDSAVIRIAAAVADRAGTLRMRLNTHNPTVSTVSADFVAAAAGAPGWEGQEWDAEMDVPATTLDDLIAAHSPPVFVKIDVEGAEDRVLAGLSHRLPALSFEFTTIARDVALRALDRLARLGPYRFNFALGETQELVAPDWSDKERMATYLEDLPHDANSGDVYARLQE